MGRITSGVGLVSGINSKDIIDQLMQLEARPKALLQTRIDSVKSQRTAYSELTARLTSLRISATTLKKPSSFQNADAASSDEGVLTATASAGAAVGSYSFQVARLVTTQQAVSRGFADFATTKIGPPTGTQTLTIGAGGGELSAENLLDDLNGGAGVQRGSIRVTDRSGKSAVIDLSAAVSLQDVIKKVNTTLDVAVRASVQGDKLLLTDQTGQSASNLIVQDIGEGKTAATLGISGSVVSATFEGADINFVGRATTLDQLNDGRGVRHASSGADFHVQTSDGSAFDVALTNAKTVADVIDAVNTASAGKVTASFDAASNGLKLTDTTGAGTTTITALNSSNAAKDLGLLGTATGGTFTGTDVLTQLGTISLRSLNGGAGLALGSFSISNRAGATTTIDLSAAKTVQDVIDGINAVRPGVTASLDRAGSGIALTDTSGGSGALTISEAGGGTTAADLGLLGAFDSSVSAVQGKNLKRQYVTENTLLAKYNAGKGVTAGTFRITDSSGRSSIVDLTQQTDVRLKDVINDINSRGLTITAGINASGDGLLLTDTGGGAQKIKVENVSGTTAADLGIETESASAVAGSNLIDGSQLRTISIDNTDTLGSVQKKINDLGFGVSAQIINDGSAATPYRLSITARSSGRDGRFVFDGGNTKLEINNLVEAKDAAVFVGDAGGNQPLLVTASKNQLGGVIRGVNIDLNGTSDKPVTLSVSNNIDNVVEEVKKFTDNFNELNGKIKELTKFDTETNERGLLLGDGTAQQAQAAIFSMLNRSVQSAGRFRVLADVGIKVGDGGELTFDEDKLRDAYSTDSESVESLFTQTPGGLTEGSSVSVLNSGRGLRTLSPPQNDFRIITRDGSTFDISLGDAISVGDVIRKINTTSGGKVTAALNELGSAISLTDSTADADGDAIRDELVVSPLAGSFAAEDLGIKGQGKNGVITGRAIPLTQQQSVAGLGYVIETAINRLIDPVDGLITRQNKTLESRTNQFEDRVKSIDKSLESKRARLERQFSNLESALSGLQSQQQSLGSIGSATAS